MSDGLTPLLLLAVDDVRADPRMAETVIRRSRRRSRLRAAGAGGFLVIMAVIGGVLVTLPAPNSAGEARLSTAPTPVSSAAAPPEVSGIRAKGMPDGFQADRIASSGSRIEPGRQSVSLFFRALSSPDLRTGTEPVLGVTVQRGSAADLQALASAGVASEWIDVAGHRALLRTNPPIVAGLANEYRLTWSPRADLTVEVLGDGGATVRQVERVAAGLVVPG